MIYGLMVHGDDLVDFMDRHSASLESLNLDMVTLKSGTWTKVSAGVQGKRALEFVEVGNLFVWRWDSEHKMLSIMWDAAINYLLSRFIFRGEPWSSELPAGYLQEAKWSEEQ